MNNVKTISVTTDGNSKRVAITFDVVDGSGKVINPNNRTNRVVVDEEALNAISILESYVQGVVDAEQEHFYAKNI